MMRKRRLFLGVLVSICLVCVSGLCACKNSGGGPVELEGFPATVAETGMYNDSYQCKSTVSDKNGNVYPLDYKVTNSVGTEVRTRNGEFPLTDILYTVKYTARISERDTRTSTVTITVDSEVPRVFIPEVATNVVGVDITLPAAIYKDDRDVGSITEYTLKYLGNDETAEGTEIPVTGTVPNAAEGAVKNGGTFKAQNEGIYKIVATGSDKGSTTYFDEHTATGERYFRVMNIETETPYDFSNAMIDDFFIGDSLSEMSVVDASTIAVASATEDAPSGTEKVLKTTWTKETTSTLSQKGLEDKKSAPDPDHLRMTYTWSNSFQEAGKISAVPLVGVLSQLTETQIQNGVLSYWVYNDSDYSYNAAYRFADANGTRKVAGDSTLPAHEWYKYDIPLLQLCGPAAFNCEISELKDKLGSLTFYISGYDSTKYDQFSSDKNKNPTPKSGDKLTLYTGKMTIQQSSYIVKDDTLIDFSQDLTKYLIDDANAEVSIVDATTETADKTPIGLPFADKESGTKVLKVVQDSNDNWKGRSGIDGTLVKSVLSQYAPGALDGKVLKFKYFVTDDCTSSDIRINLRWFKDASATKESIACSGIFPGMWQEVCTTIKEFNKVDIDDLKNKTDHLDFYTYADPQSKITFYVSNIYIEDGPEYTLTNEKPYDFQQEGGIRQYAIKSKPTWSTSIVDASATNAEDTPVGAPSGDDKVLRFRWKKQEPDSKGNQWNVYSVLDATPLKNVLSQMTENEIRNAVLSYWVYNDSDWAYTGTLIFRNTDSTPKRYGTSVTLSVKAWNKVTYSLNDLIDNGLASGVNDLVAGNIKDLAFYVSGYDSKNDKYPDSGTVFNLFLSDISISTNNEEYTVNNDGKLVDFGQNAITAYLKHGDNVPSTEVVTVGGDGDEVKSLPYDTQTDDNKALKITFCNKGKDGWRDTKALISATIFQQALAKYPATDLKKGTIKFKVYCKGSTGGGMTINICNKDRVTNSNWSRNDNVRFANKTQIITANAWTEFAIPISGSGTWANGGPNANKTNGCETAILGGSKGTYDGDHKNTYNNSFGDGMLAAQLAENFGSIGFYYNNVNNNILYLSDIYLEIDAGKEVTADPVIQTIKLVDFMSLGADKLSHSSDVKSAEIVTIGNADIGTLPYVKQAEDTKALKLTFVRTTGDWIDTNALIASDVFETALSGVDSSNLAKATLKFKVYCKGSTGGGMTINICNKDHMTWANKADNTGRADNVRFALATSTMTGNAWTEYAIPISGSGTWANGGPSANKTNDCETTILGGIKGTYDSDHKNTYNNAFGGLTAAQLAENFGSIGLFYNNNANDSTGNILYVSNIYLEYEEEEA